MPLTRDFKETVKQRATKDPKFRKELLREAIQALVEGEADVAKLLYRNYINATVGFDEVAKAVGKSPKSLMRMFSNEGNPNLNNFTAVTGYLAREGYTVKVVSVPSQKRRKATGKNRVAAKH